MQSNGAGSIRRAGLLFVAGILPLAGFLAELATGMFSDCVWQLFPTPLHVFAVGLATLLNLGLHGPGRDRWLAGRTAALGYVTGAALLYALVEAPALPLIAVAVPLGGLGLLAAAPYWTCLGLGALWPDLWRRWRAKGRGVWSLLGVALPAVLLLPGWFAGQHWLRVRTLRAMHAAATAVDSAVARANLAWLRAAPLAAQQAACRGDGDQRWPGDGPSWFLDRSSPPPRLEVATARAVFHLAHGRAWDDDAADLSLAGSDLLVAIERDAALARIDWQLAFANRGRFAAEADAEIRLPEGGVASALSLWIAGVERPAAFGGLAAVRSAYAEVVRARRDPALLQEVAPGRLRLQVFPVPSGGQPVRARIVLTVPLHLRDDRAWLQLPELQVPGCATAAVEHRAAIVDGSRRQELRAPVGRLARVLPCARASAWANCEDADGMLRQELVPVPPAPWPTATLLVLAFDGSASAAAGLQRREPVLDALPAGTPCTLLVAESVGCVRRDGIAGEAELRRWLAAREFAGGIDAAPMLAQAATIALARAGSRIVWLHGDQPVAHAAIGPVRNALAQCGAPVIALPLTGGSNVVRDALAGAVTAVPRSDDPAADLRWAFARGSALEAAERRWSRPAAIGTGEPTVTDQLARLWATTAAREQVRSNRTEAAAALARRYRLVTAGVGAVVLEGEEEYARHGLDPGAPVGIEPTEHPLGSPVPEPATWLLFGGGILMLLLRARFAARQPAPTARPWHRLCARCARG